MMLKPRLPDLRLATCLYVIKLKQNTCILKRKWFRLLSVLRSTKSLLGHCLLMPPLCVCFMCVLSWPRGYKTFSMFNSAEHEIYPAHKC